MANLPPALASAVEALRSRYPSAAAIIFYGSCLRDRSSEGLLDFYVLVDRYSDVMGCSAALGAHVLPPNVYRHSLGDLRAKVAVMRVGDFLHGLGAGWFTPMLSARFAQPCAVVHVREGALEDRLAQGFLTAAETCIVRTLPLMSTPFGARAMAARLYRKLRHRAAP